tara:strand:+ start:2289 stop:2603 length:315 start_codon:yes stop_codon:yes gene_type:complete
MKGERQHWLVRATTIRQLWFGFWVVLGLSLLAGLWVHQHLLMGIEDYFGFFGGYGFLACLVMVGLAKLLGRLLKRPDDYYRAATRSLDSSARSTASQRREPGDD